MARFGVLFFLLLGHSTAWAMNCNLDGQGLDAFPVSQDVGLLAEAVVGSNSSLDCSGTLCDFDQNGQAPQLGDVARLLQAVRSSGAPDALCVDGNTTPACSSDLQCNDNDSGTRNSCQNAGQGIAYCQFTNSNPTANISTTTTTYTVNESFVLSGTGSDSEEGTLSGTRLSWSKNGQTVGTGTSVTVTESSIGTVVYTLTATDSKGLTGTDTITLTIQAPPFPQVAGRYTLRTTTQTSTHTLCGDPGEVDIETWQIAQNGTALTITESPGVGASTFSATMDQNGAFTFVQTASESEGGCTATIQGTYSLTISGSTKQGTGSLSATVTTGPRNACPASIPASCTVTAGLTLTPQ